MGYRSDFVYELSKSVASGRMELKTLCASSLSTSQLKRNLLSIKGVGSYAAATLLMLVGRFDELPIDSVCRDFVTRRYFRGERPTDPEIRQIYEDWGPWKYLAYWFDLWHGDAE